MCRARNTAVIVFLLIPWRKWLGKIVNDTTTNDSATFDIYLHGAWKRKKTFKSGNHSLEEYAQWRLRLKGCAQIVTYAVVGQKTWEWSVWVSVCRFYWVYFESLTWCSGKCYLFINLKTFYIKTNELVLFFCCNGDARIVPWMWPCFFAIVILSYSFARKCSFQYKNVVNSIKRRNAVKLQSKFVLSKRTK